MQQSLSGSSQQLHILASLVPHHVHLLPVADVHWQEQSGHVDVSSVGNSRQVSVRQMQTEVQAFST